MSNQSNRVPSYRRHKQSGQGIVTLTDGLGGRRDLLFGKYGTKASRSEYARIVSEWETSGRRAPPNGDSKSDLTINELMLRYWDFARGYYRKHDGSASREIVDIRLSLKPLKSLYGHTPAASFGPLALKTVREAMISGSWMDEKEKQKRIANGKPIDWCRTLVNQRLGRIKRMFRWAVENELVPTNTLHGLEAVRGLSRGRCAARESAPVKPVPDAFVDQTLQHLPQTVADMIGLQRVTGMRSGELVIMRACDLDTSGRVWLYRPGSDRGPEGEHKTAHKGFSRVIAIGPRGQDIVRRYLKQDLGAYLFSPRDRMQAWRAEQRSERKTNVQPSQQSRKKRTPRKGAGERYTSQSYGQAIRKACFKADVPLWSPHKLRHSFGTAVRRQFGLEPAQVLLGHAHADVTQIYVERNLDLAQRVAAEIG